jgi:xanthine/CO dehydrogenase XdhC/CoxF family maturation factor
VWRAEELPRDAGVRPGHNVYTPIGLDLGGGGSAADIALSIASEIQAVRGGGAALAHRRENVPFS